ncbi:MAG TPA: hypothetical protein QF564_22350 [Pirellulaceae bacterium]|nr:hypothetical protein [Pirellulaceae bacterium]
MMPRLLALEWDGREARVAVARTRGSDIVVEHAFVVDLELGGGQTPAESEVGKRVAAALAARNLGRTETLVAIGRTSIELRQLALPPSPVEELPELVRFQALRQFTTISEDWPIDFVHVDAGDSESLHVIAAAISPDLVRQIQGTCESADQTAKRLVLRPFAAASLLHRRDKDRQPPCTLMVDLLAEEVDLTVMVDNQVAMMRTVRSSIGNGAEAQSRALLGEIRRTIAAAQNQLSGHRVERIVICGDGSDQSTLKALVEDKLTCKVELFSPFSDVQVEGELAESKPEHPGRFAPLLGMLADEAAGAAHGIDFLHPRERPTPPSPWRNRGLYIGLGVAVCAVVAMVLVVSGMNMDAEIADLQEESQALEKTVDKAKKKSDDVNRVEDFLRTDYAWLDELKELSDTMPPADDVILTQLNMIAIPSGGQIALDGYTMESSQIEDVQRALRSGGRRVVPKGGGVDPRRNEYRWQFKELIALPLRTDLTANVAKPTAVTVAPELETPAEAVQEVPAKDAPRTEPPVDAPAQDPPVIEPSDLEAAALNKPVNELAPVEAPIQDPPTTEPPVSKADSPDEPAGKPAAADGSSQDAPATELPTVEVPASEDPLKSDPPASTSP